MKSRDQLFNQQASTLGYSFDGEIKIGGNYVPLLQDGKHIYISGQIPRVGNDVVVTGAAGSDDFVGCTKGGQNFNRAGIGAIKKSSGHIGCYEVSFTHHRLCAIILHIHTTK